MLTNGGEGTSHDNCVCAGNYNSFGVVALLHLSFSYEISQVVSLSAVIFPVTTSSIAVHARVGKRTKEALGKLIVKIDFSIQRHYLS